MEFGQSIARVPWGAVMMVAATSILGNALTNEEVGLTSVVVDALTPIISNMSPAFFVFIVCFFTLFLQPLKRRTV